MKCGILIRVVDTISPYGGIGRHRALKMLRSHGHAGSIPAKGT